MHFIVVQLMEGWTWTFRIRCKVERHKNWPLNKYRNWEFRLCRTIANYCVRDLSQARDGITVNTISKSWNYIQRWNSFILAILFLTESNPLRDTHKHEKPLKFNTHQSNGIRNCVWNTRHWSRCCNNYNNETKLRTEAGKLPPVIELQLWSTMYLRG